MCGVTREDIISSARLRGTGKVGEDSEKAKQGKTLMVRACQDEERWREKATREKHWKWKSREEEEEEEAGPRQDGRTEQRQIGRMNGHTIT